MPYLPAKIGNKMSTTVFRVSAADSRGSAANGLLKHVSHMPLHEHSLMEVNFNLLLQQRSWYLVPLHMLDVL